VIGHKVWNTPRVDTGVKVINSQAAFIHNTIIDHRNAGVSLDGASRGYLRDNIFAENQTAVNSLSSDVYGHFNVFFDNNTNRTSGLFENDILSDPDFAQPSVGDYRLAIGSTIRGAGMSGRDPGVYDGASFFPFDIREAVRHRYRIVDFEDFGEDESVVHAVATEGWFVGQAKKLIPGCGQTSCVFDRGAGTTFADRLYDTGPFASDNTNYVPSGNFNSYMMDLNDSAKFVGYTRDANTGTSEARFWWDYYGESHQANVNIGLGTLGGQNSKAFALNEIYEVVGESNIASGNLRAFHWYGVMNDLGSLPGTSCSSAQDINEQSVTVGFSGTGTSSCATGLKATRWDGNIMTELASLNGLDSYALAVNDSDVAVGKSGTQPVFWDSQGVHSIGILSFSSGEARGINNNGEVVGELGGKQSAFYYDPAADQTVDLNEWIDPQSGWTLKQANDINDAGMIVGEGEWAGVKRGFILTPVE
jgi:probable HAF family extracellular repeat protein